MRVVVAGEGVTGTDVKLTGQLGQVTGQVDGQLMYNPAILGR